MANNDAEIKVSADASGVEAGMRQAAQAVQVGVEKMRTHFDSLGSTFSKIQGMMLGLTAALAGGAAFKSAVEETVNLTKEAQLLARTLGISATEASILNVALGDVYITSDQVVTATSKITKTLNGNEEAFTKLGIATRDADGHLRNSFDILLDTNKALMRFREGTDRNIEGQKIFGKAWAEVSTVLRVNAEVMEESKKKAEALGLVVGAENVQATVRYRAAMNDVNDVMTAVKKVIGDAVIPILTDLGNWFAGYGPAAVDVMKKAMAGLVTAFYGLKMVVQIAWETLKAGVQQSVVMLLTLADVGAKALQFDFSGAKNAWDRGMGQIRDISAKWGDTIVKDAESNRDKIFAAWSGTTSKPTPTQRQSGGSFSEGGTKSDKGKTDSRMNEWEVMLERQKLAHEKMNEQNGTFYAFSKQREADYWSAILQRQDLSKEERLNVEKKYLAASLVVRKDQFEASVAQLKAELDAFKFNSEEKHRIASQLAEQMKQKFGEESKEYKEARAKLIEIDRNWADQVRAIYQLQRENEEAERLASVEDARRAKQLDLDLGLITQAQMLEAERKFEDERLAIQRQALEQKIEMLKNDPDKNPEALEKLNNQKLELERQYAAKAGEIRNKQVLEANKDWKSMTDSMQSGLQNVIASVLKGTMTMGQAIKSLFQTVLGAIADMLAKKAAQFIANMILEKIIGKATAASQISANAGVAASAAMASVAAIPFYGWAMAPGVGAATFAGAMGYQAAALSAAGGFDIPAGINPIVQAHQREMILPEKHADVIRSLADEGGGGASPINLTIQATDSRSVERLFMDNGPALAKAIREQIRNFTPTR